MLLLLPLILLQVLLMIMPTFPIHQVQQCWRGECVVVGDRETGWQFDQPEPIFIDRDGGHVRRMLGGGGVEEEMG